MTLEPTNTAPTTTTGGITVETFPPTPLYTGDAPQSGTPSNTPSSGYGSVSGTIIDATNKKRDHVCGFIDSLKHDLGLKDFFRAVGKYIRDAIRAVLKAMGFSDPSGKLTYYANLLKALAREIKAIRVEILQPIIDFEKYVLAYVTKIRAIIQWILSLPLQLLALLKNCLERLLKLIGSVFADIITGALGSLPDTPTEGLSDAIAAAKEVAQEAYKAAQSVSTIVGLAITIPAAATIGLLAPVSQSDLDAANNYIQTYNSENPTVSEFTGRNTNILVQWGMPSQNSVSNYIFAASKPTF